MIPKCNPAVAGAFAYATMDFFFLPTEDTFGPKTSSAEYYPLARARAFLAEHLSRDEPLVMKHVEILNFVKFKVESEPFNVVYTQTTPETIHKGVYDPTRGRDVNNPHKPFVDDTFISENRCHTPTDMAASIE